MAVFTYTRQQSTTSSTVGYENYSSSEPQSESFLTKSVTTSPAVSTGFLISLQISNAVIAVLAMLGNGIVLGGFWLARRSKLTSSTYYIANQTTLELLGCVMIAVKMVMKLTGAFKYNGNCPAATILCVLVDGGGLIKIGLYGSTTGLVIMTLDRYWKIVHAVHHRNHYRRWMLRVGLCLPWLSVVVMDLLPGALGATRISNGTCMPLAFWPSKAVARIYGVFMFLWQFIIPMIVLVAAYWKIFKVVKRQGKVRTDRPGNMGNAPISGTSRGTLTAVEVVSDSNKGRQEVSNGRRGIGSQAGPKRLSQTQINVLKTMVYVTVCFAVCWMPLYFYILLSQFGVVSAFNNDPAGRLVATLAYCQILLDPAIYIAHYDVVRRALTRFVRRATVTVTTNSTD